MASGKNSDRYIVVVDQERIEPDLARETVINYDPLNRSGKEGGFYLDEEGHLHIDDDDVMEAHRMAIKKYPDPKAIRMVQLVSEPDEGPLHQYGENAFRLYGCPVPEEGSVIGLLGENGTGKSTALRILAGDLRPNLGEIGDGPGWDEVAERHRGTGLQQQFSKLAGDGIEAAFKPQQVEKLREEFDGTVNELLEKADERGARGEIAERLELEKLLDRELGELSGGELQRVAVAATALNDADLYVFDEPSSFLDVRQRLEVSREIRRLSDDAAVMVVEHDLASLDLVSDRIHVFYGDPGSYGMVSDAMSCKEGINQYLNGRLESDNVRIREESLDFGRTKRSQVERNREVLDYPELEKSFGEDGFSLEVSPGAVHGEEVLGVLGENGLGKTVLASMIAGVLQPDAGDLPEIEVSYKPQKLEAEDETMRQALSRHVNPESQEFQTRISGPLHVDGMLEENLKDLSGGELQRVGVAAALARDAELYVLDEPSAFLDVEGRMALARTLKRFARKTEKPLMVVDHDLMLLDYIADRGKVFSGEPGIHGSAHSPVSIEPALDRFLQQVGITYRKDPDTGRPRANKPGSQKDSEQRERGEYYGG